MNFKVTTENFEGPIDLLLQLIEKRKLPINEVSLAQIADDYIRFVTNMEKQSLSHVTFFIFVASTLTLIKSKSLLPNLNLEPDEEKDIEELKKHIALFKIFKEAALNIKKTIATKRNFYYPKPRKQKIIFTPHADLSPDKMLEAIGSIFSEIPKKENTKKEASMRIAVHIDSMMKSLEKRITKMMKTDFSSYVADESQNEKNPKQLKVYNIIGFLAMLELVKNGALHVIQTNNFDEISMESNVTVNREY